MGLFSKPQIDKQFEFDQGVTAIEKNDDDKIFKHSVQLLWDDRANPDGWILRAALQLHGRDFDLDKVTRAKNTIMIKAIGKTFTTDELKDAFSSYKRAISYSKDDSVLYQYAFIFGYSMAHHVTHSAYDEDLDGYKTIINRMIEESNKKFGHDCSKQILSRMVTGYKQYVASASRIYFEEETNHVLHILKSLANPSSINKSESKKEIKNDEEDEEDEDFFEDEDEDVTLTVMKGKKSCTGYSVEVSLDREVICTLDKTFSEKVTVTTGEYKLSITAENDEDMLDVEDNIDIDEDSVLKIKIANGELRYSLDEE